MYTIKERIQKPVKSYRTELVKMLAKHITKDDLYIDEDDDTRPIEQIINEKIFLEKEPGYDVEGTDHYRIGIDYSAFDEIAKFDLTELPSCCGVTVLQHFEIDHNLRKAGLGTLINKLAIAKAKEEGYTMVMGTDLASNKAHKKLLAKNGWELLDSFTNNRTKNKLNVFGYKINRRKKDLPLGL